MRAWEHRSLIPNIPRKVEVPELQIDLKKKQINKKVYEIPRSAALYNNYARPMGKIHIAINMSLRNVICRDALTKESDTVAVHFDVWDSHPDISTVLKPNGLLF